MQIMRMVVTGPVGAGKSTYIQSISEIQVVDTDRQATDDTLLMKQKTTVAFDFGRLHFGKNMALHLYGTPGQARFDFMWDMLIRKAHIYVMLVAAHRPHEFRYARRILSFMEHRSRAPYIVGITHTDMEGAWDIDDMPIALGMLDENKRPPIVVVNPRDATSVKRSVVVTVQHFIETKKQQRTSSPVPPVVASSRG
jgi:signal recognition particle receptor subunit beta